jgi:hypothetical protein
MYVKRATVNVLKSIIIVIASFTSMAHLLSKGNHAHPRFNCNLIIPIIPNTYKRSFKMLLSFLLTFRVSENVVVSAKPRDLSPAPFWAGPLADLVSQVCAAKPSQRSGKMFKHQGLLAIRSVDTVFSDALTSSNHFQIAL